MGTKADSDSKKKNLLFENWVKENIYNYNKADSVAYLVLYLLIPVIITVISLSELPKDNIARLYCYITILISVFNSIYDSFGRWNSNNKSVRNTKLFLIVLSNVFVAIYCIFIIMEILISSNLKCRFDEFLCVYFIAIIVSLFDIGACFFKDMAFRQCI